MVTNLKANSTKTAPRKRDPETPPGLLAPSLCPGEMRRAWWGLGSGYTVEGPPPPWSRCLRALTLGSLPSCGPSSARTPVAGRAVQPQCLDCAADTWGLCVGPEGSLMVPWSLACVCEICLFLGTGRMGSSVQGTALLDTSRLGAWPAAAL